MQANLSVNAVSFASNTQIPTQSRSFCSAGCSHHNVSDEGISFPRGLVMKCNPRIWRNISCRNLESVAYDDSFRQTVCYSVKIHIFVANINSFIIK